MSQPNRESSIAEARDLYEEELKEIRFYPPHDGAGNCTSMCGKEIDCPIIPFEEWLEEFNLKYRDE
jgi:hypothetical protein